MNGADLAGLVDVAIALGRLRIVSEGQRGLPAPLPKPVDERWRPEACGAGRMLCRLPGLDAYDRRIAR